MELFFRLRLSRRSVRHALVNPQSIWLVTLLNNISLLFWMYECNLACLKWYCGPVSISSKDWSTFSQQVLQSFNGLVMDWTNYRVARHCRSQEKHASRTHTHAHPGLIAQTGNSDRQLPACLSGLQLVSYLFAQTNASAFLAPSVVLSECYSPFQSMIRWLSQIITQPISAEAQIDIHSRHIRDS